MNYHRHIADANKPRTRDPTKTLVIRRQIAATADTRLNRLKANVRRAVVDEDVLGLSPEHRFAYGPIAAAKVRAFDQWFVQAGQQLLLDDQWMVPYIGQAMNQGVADAHKELPDPHFMPIDLHQTAALMAHIGQRETASILTATHQGITRVAGQALTKYQGTPPHRVFGAMNVAFQKIARPRMKLFTHYLMTRSYNKAKLLTYNANGVKQVGVLPELLNRPMRLALDADDDQIDVVTAGDDLVCDECEDVADEGPYDLDEADDLLPVHPNCRCTFIVHYSGRRNYESNPIGDPDDEDDSG